MGIIKVHLTSSQMIDNSLDDTRYSYTLGRFTRLSCQTQKRTLTICCCKKQNNFFSKTKKMIIKRSGVITAKQNKSVILYQATVQG